MEGYELKKYLTILLFMVYFIIEARREAVKMTNTLNGTDLLNSLKVYLPTDKRSKSNIRGFWKGQSGLCYDYIRQTRIKEGQQGFLQKRHRQEALFYTRKGKAYIWHSSRKVEELRRYRYFGHSKEVRGLKAFLKGILDSYGGFTLYVKETQYLAEVWTK